MINYFLPANRFLKISLLEQLCMQPLKLSIFSRTNQIPFTTIKRYLNELQVEIESYGYSFSLTYTDSDTCILEKRTTDSNHLTVGTIEEIKLDILKTYSPSFQICMLLCEGERLNLSDLQRYLSLSKSQVYKTINELFSLLEPRKIGISFNDYGFLEFIGDELDIRIFMYNFISECFPKKHWFFTKISKYQVKMDLKKFCLFSDVSVYTIDKLCTFFAILQSRLLSKKILSPIRSDFHSAFLRFTYLSLEDLQIYFTDKRLFDEELQYIEYLHINFFLRIFIPDAISEKNVLEIGHHIEQSSNPDHIFLSNFLSAWQKHFDISLPDQKRPILLYNSGLLAIFAFFLPNNISQFLTNNPNDFQEDSINKNLFSKIAIFVTQFVDTCELSERKKNYLKEKGIPYFISLYYLETLMFFHPKLNIYMYFTTDYTSEDLLKNRIEQFYNPNVIKFVTTVEDADVILTDSYEDYPSNIKTIPVFNALTTSKISSIMESIHTTLVSQLII